ncbi:hypothetical protein PIROE2DRAFT_63664 [Piromyces sp. E2]|nr:hypothetical protein PIROE2DRAFT_63664 [Piromyces sp. E2]|eukprot:OUM59611.1 hypothetical protein PIROE2DRAFT_63664 [Piromyces sp. E2]
MAIQNNNLEFIRQLIEVYNIKLNLFVNDIYDNNPYKMVIKNSDIKIFKYLYEHPTHCNIKNNSILTDVIYNYDALIYLLDKNININIKNNKGEYPLIKAITCYNIDATELIINYAIEKNYKLDIVDHQGNSPLLISYNKLLRYKIFPDIFLCLLKYIKHFKINKRSNEGNTILYYTIINNDLKSTKYLINNGADVNSVDNKKNSALDLTIKNTNKRITIYLIYSHKRLINMVNDEGDNPIITLMKSNFNMKDKKNIMYHLIKNGCNINFSDKNGNNPFTIAKTMNNFSLIKMFTKYSNMSLNAYNNEIFYSLKNAVLNNDIEQVQSLIVQTNNINANLNIKCKNGNPLLIYAYNLWWKIKSTFNKKIINILIENLNLNKRDSKGNTILYYAIKNNDFEVVKKLNMFKANIYSVDHNNNSALDLAIKVGNKKIIIYFILNGDEKLINAINDKDETPLISIVKKNMKKRYKKELIFYLIKSNSNINYTDKNGDTAISYSERKNEFWLSSLLKKYLNS